MKTMTVISLMVLCGLTLSCAPRFARDETFKIHPEFLHMHHNGGNYHIRVVSVTPGTGVSVTTNESWIAIPDLENATTPLYVHIIVNPNLAPGWRTGYVHFYAAEGDEAILAITQRSEPSERGPRQ